MKRGSSLIVGLIFLLSQSIAWTQILPNGQIDNIDELIKMDTIYIPMSDGTLLATTIAYRSLEIQ